jgi:serine/threonine protein kinase
LPFPPYIRCPGTVGEPSRNSIQVATGKVVALKIIDLDTPDDDITEIQREVALLSQLRDADKYNCTLYFGCWMHESELWIAMEYASGGSIRTVVSFTFLGLP